MIIFSPNNLEQNNNKKNPIHTEQNDKKNWIPHWIDETWNNRDGTSTTQHNTETAKYVFNVSQTTCVCVCVFKTEQN